MTVILLVFIYIIFIGLGVPDSVSGAAFPAVFAEFNVPVSYGGFITATISLCTVIAGLFSARLINRFGAGLVSAFSTLLTALALLGNAFAPAYFWLVICAIPTGLGAGAIDAALNNYVAVHYKPSQLNFLHCFYGVGIALSPYLFSFALKDGNWRAGYLFVFYVQISITVVSFIALFVWKRVTSTESPEKKFAPRTLKYKDMAKNPVVRLSWLVFFSTVALEFTCDHWSTTYLVETTSTAKDVAAKFLSLYFIGITSGRLISGLVSNKVAAEKIIFTGYGVVLVAIITLMLPVPATVKGISLFFIGFGNGPTFPNLTYLSPKIYGKDVSQSIVGSQMAAANLGILTMPALFGLLAQAVSVRIFPFFLAALYLIMLLSTIAYFKKASSNTQNNA